MAPAKSSKKKRSSYNKKERKKTMPEKKEKKSSYNENKNKYSQKYIHENYDQLSIRIPKVGTLTRKMIADAAAFVGMSVNAFILAAVGEKIEREGIILQGESSENAKNE